MARIIGKTDKPSLRNRSVRAWKNDPILPQGVLCGVDAFQEWLLPWWWSRFHEHNKALVSFCDFGMSQEARLWCQKRGNVIDLFFDPLSIVPKEQINKERVVDWEAIYGPSIWQARLSWFKKPAALLSTLYLKTIWVDLDCEILDSIEPLFEMCSRKEPVALVREPGQFPPKYNSGLIIYQHGASLIEHWADEASCSSQLFWGDDPLLSHLILSQKYLVKEISEIWNWRMSYGFSIDAKIYHWVGSGGKHFIRERGGIKPSLDAFLAKITPKIHEP